jgi:ubiquinone/menaquinone biosynthesis C-methylase UbiE
LKYKNKGSWDARTYDQVSYLVQYRWGKQVLEWRKWQGNEIVMDAGCGSGLLTKELAKKVPRGNVYAVDIDSNMIKQARNNLQFFDNVEIIQSSFADIKLARKLNVIFSNSALHWVQDHRKVFQNFWEMLKPMNSNNKNTTIGSNGYTASSGGDSQLLIQCGRGEENRLKRENEMLKVKKSEFEYLKEKVEETKRAQAKFANDYMQVLKSKLGIAPDVNKFIIEIDPDVKDLDKELGF